MGVAKLKAVGSKPFLLPLTHPSPRFVSDKHTSHIIKATVIGLVLLVLFGYTHCDSVVQYFSSAKRNPAYLIKAQHGAVASENKRCSDIGVDVLREGGNAVDAAIAATFCTGVVNMFSYAFPRLYAQISTHGIVLSS
jgi:gamma-glutamyltranspeptidase/glutathione hydrolase/leukotriene-C4 hydrolase